MDDTKQPSPPPVPPPSPTLLRHLINLDTTLSHRLYTLTKPILPYSLLKSLEISGDGFLFFPLLLSFLLFPSPSLTLTPTTSTTTTLLLNLLLGGILDILLIGLLKHLIRRPRPIYNKNMFVAFSPDHWSFPSGHSSRVSFIATFFYLHSTLIHQLLLLFLSSSTQSEGKFSSITLLFADYFVFIVFIWALLTSVSRILLGRHFVLDVVVGLIVGVLEGIFVFRVFNYHNLSSFFSQILPAYASAHSCVVMLSYSFRKLC